MKKLALLACSLLTITLTYGQDNKIKTVPEKRKAILIDENQTQVSSSTQPASESAYFGYDQKIAAISLNSSIPAGFPTKEGYTSKATYLTAINKWIKENPTLIKPEHKDTVITDK